MSIHQDISSSNIQLHVCTVERVYTSGLVDARSDRDLFFEQINHTFGGAETNYTIGCRCVVLSDGSQHIAVGQIRDPEIDDSGQVTTKNIKNDLSDLTNAKALVATDNFGSQAKVVAAPGGGVILDSGENSMMHFDPGCAKIMALADRSETITVPFCAEHEHNGVTAQSSYKWRTTADLLSWDRDVGREREDALDIGGILTVDIGPAPDMLTLEYKVNDVVQSRMEISTTGAVTIEGGVVPTNHTLKLDPVNGLELSGPASGLTINPAGQIQLGNGAVDVLQLMDQMLGAAGGLSSPVSVITALGPVALVTAPFYSGLNLALQAIKPPLP